jgi:hypothetical protein
MPHKPPKAKEKQPDSHVITMPADQVAAKTVLEQSKAKRHRNSPHVEVAGQAEPKKQEMLVLFVSLSFMTLLVSQIWETTIMEAIADILPDQKWPRVAARAGVGTVMLLLLGVLAYIYSVRRAQEAVAEDEATQEALQYFRTKQGTTGRLGSTTTLRPPKKSSSWDFHGLPVGTMGSVVEALNSFWTDKEKTKLLKAHPELQHPFSTTGSKAELASLPLLSKTEEPAAVMVEESQDSEAPHGPQRRSHRNHRKHHHSSHSSSSSRTAHHSNRRHTHKHRPKDKESPPATPRLASPRSPSSTVATSSPRAKPRAKQSHTGTQFMIGSPLEGCLY